jgi:hypothetical protein
MPFSIYDASVTVFARMLSAQLKVLDRAEAFASGRKLEPALVLASRLYPDMFPYSRQIQVATDNAKGPAARLAGVEVPRYADTETTFDELRARIARTIAFISGLDRGRFEGAEDRDITFITGGKERVMKGQSYLLDQALPNFFFHVTTSYAILRHLGLEIGKRDFMSP